VRRSPFVHFGLGERTITPTTRLTSDGPVPCCPRGMGIPYHLYQPVALYIRLGIRWTRP